MPVRIEPITSIVRLYRPGSPDLAGAGDAALVIQHIADGREAEAITLRGTMTRRLWLELRAELIAAGFVALHCSRHGRRKTYRR